jgi:hypothetical protein
MNPCRQCGTEVSEEAPICPKCGEPHPGKDQWDGWGFEYKSRASLFGLPLIHVAFKYRANRTPVLAKGIIAVGQFAVGVVTLSQFGLGLFSLSQFTLAGFAVAQFALAYSLIAQFGIYVHQGQGQFVASLLDILHLLS